MNVTFNRRTNQATGLNRPAGPFEYSVELPYEITLSKQLQKVVGEKHKKNDQGQMLYKDNVVVSETGEETYDEVTEARKAIAWEDRTVTYKIDGEEVKRIVQQPTKWEELAPVMTDDVLEITAKFPKRLEEFTYLDVLEAKKAAIQENNLRQLVHFDEDFTLDTISDDLSTHAADLGDGIIALHPNGQARTEKIALPAAAEVIQVYTEMQDDITVEVGPTASDFHTVVDGVVTLPAAADAVYIRFTNQAAERRDVFAYGILI